jgi:protein SCO1/2
MLLFGRGTFRTLTKALLGGLLLAVASPAQAFGPNGPDHPAPRVAEPPKVTVNEHLGSTLPENLTFTDETGKTVQLKDYFHHDRPVVIQMGYFQCPMLCSLISQGVVNAFKEVSLVPGKDYDYLFISIDPSEKPDLAARKKQSYVAALGAESVGGWHLLTGTQESIAPLADAIGFEYKWVPSAGQFAHPAVITFCSPDAKITRYLYGVQFNPQTVRLSLVESSAGKVGTTVDRWVLTCLEYDGHQGKYALAAIRWMRGGGVMIILVVAGVLLRQLRRELKVHNANMQGQSPAV